MLVGEITHEAVSIDDGGKEFTGIELANHLNNYFVSIVQQLSMIIYKYPDFEVLVF